MTLSTTRRSRAPLLLGAAAALTAALLAQAQQPPAGASSAPATSPAPKKSAASGTTKPGESGAAPSEKDAVSYSLGVSMGDQLRSNGIASDAVNPQRLAQGVHDALSGKAKLTEADQNNISRLVRGSIEGAGEANHRAAAKFLAENGKKPGVITTASGLQYKVQAPGNGESPKAADEVTVNYRGTLLDGTEFDSSYRRGQPATFQVGKVIPGWTEALQLMKPGAKYELFIPPQLAYDMRSRPPIPPGSMLIFDVELLSSKPAQPPAAASPPAGPASPPPPK
ncbi:MAG TPA: FKBP-type peptidyl-prolyl cis-trans isomerase [Steroidobacteraceae bacterium]|nr:FKBP-type peptidyl-prolyl cis-trans isomerase [Steroidobacteraceae bacterium]